MSMRPLRITIVSETYAPQVNGVSRTLERLVDYLSARGDRVQLIIPRYGETQPCASTGLEKNEWRGLRLPFYREVVLPLARPASIRHNLEAFAPDLVHIATEGPLGLSALRAAVKAKIPVVSSYHTNFSQYLGSYRAAFLETLAWRYLRWFHNSTSLTFCPTPSIREILQEKGFRNVHIWSRGVDCQRFSPANRDLQLRAAHGIDPDDLVLAYAGRLAAEKNLEMLFDAWRGLAKRSRERCRLLLIGDGPLRERLMQEADERVIFPGYRHGEELARFYAAADLFVFPSLTETFGNVILEGMASGLPAVAFRVPGPKDIITHGSTGLLVDRVDPSSFAQALVQLLDRPRELRRMAGAARRYAEAQSWGEILEGVRGAYSAHVAARGKKDPEQDGGRMYRKDLCSDILKK